MERVLRESKAFLIQKFKKYRLENEVVMRELLLNAIVHGNGNNPQKTVFCDIKAIDETRFQLEVKDQGEGFDHKALDLSLPEKPNKLRKRGLILVSGFSEKLEFNKKGNHATARLNSVQNGANDNYYSLEC